MAMTPQKYERIKEAVEEAKVKKARAEGAKEQTLAGWKESIQCASLEEATEYLKKLMDKIDEQEKRLESLFEELDGLTEWDEVLQ